jgi:hypothetical protein
MGSGVLKTLQLALRSDVRALQAVLGLPEAVKHGDLSLGVGLFENVHFDHFHPGQFPLRDCHLFHIELFGPGLGMPFDFQVVAEVIEFLAIFTRQHDGAGAKSVTEGVHANSSLSIGGLGASRFLRVAPIGLELFECCHRVFLTNKAKLGGEARRSMRFVTNKANLANLFAIAAFFLANSYSYSHNSAASEGN